MGLTMLFSHCIFLCDTILQIFQALGHYYMSGDSFSYVSAYFQAENVGQEKGEKIIATFVHVRDFWQAFKLIFGSPVQSLTLNFAITL